MKRICVFLMLLVGLSTLAVAPQMSMRTLAAGGPWITTGSLRTARYFYTATLLLNGQVLVAGGISSSGDVIASAELYNPASGTWTATGSLHIARENHAAALLPNGQVLVAGGDSVNGSLASAELYNPASGTWTVTGSLHVARTLRTAVLLRTGRVLVSGGVNLAGETVDSAELYDPRSGTWALTGSLHVARENHTATVLPTGQVLVVGGVGPAGTITNSAELYDPSSGNWALTGSLHVARALRTASLLPTGQVLVVGGVGPSGVVAAAELYNPSSGIWTITGSLHTARCEYSQTLLPTGQVLVAGGIGSNGDIVASAELYDPTSGIWTLTGPLHDARENGTAILLPNGQVLVAGGSGNRSLALASAELFTRDTMLSLPIIYVPATIRVNTTHILGVTVRYTVIAVDPANPLHRINATCTPASGSIFPLGTTTVHCSTIDSQGTTAVTSFLVIVKNSSPNVTITLPLLSITKVPENGFNYRVGQSVTYDITVKNDAHASPEQQPVTVTDSIPAGFSHLTFSGLGWSGNFTSTTSPAVFSATHMGGLNPGASLPILKLTGTLNADAIPMVINAASVTSADDTSIPTTTIFVSPLFRAAAEIRAS